MSNINDVVFRIGWLCLTHASDEPLPIYKIRLVALGFDLLSFLCLFIYLSIYLFIGLLNAWIELCNLLFEFYLIICFIAYRDWLGMALNEDAELIEFFMHPSSIHPSSLSVYLPVRLSSYSSAEWLIKEYALGSDYCCRRFTPFPFCISFIRFFTGPFPHCPGNMHVRKNFRSIRRVVDFVVSCLSFSPIMPYVRDACRIDLTSAIFTTLCAIVITYVIDNYLEYLQQYVGSTTNSMGNATK